MVRARSLLLVLGLAALAGCGADAPGAPGGTEHAAATRQPSAREQAVIRYVGMPTYERLGEPYAGRTSLDPATGLPRRTGGCIVMPGEEEEIAAHNARVRAACARGELRAFQLDHKFMPVGALVERFAREGGAVLAPDAPVVSPDGTYRIEVQLEEPPRASHEYWQALLHAPEQPPRRFGPSGPVGTSWRVLFAHDGTTLLVKRGETHYEVHDLPTREIVQLVDLP